MAKGGPLVKIFNRIREEMEIARRDPRAEALRDAVAAGYVVPTRHATRNIDAPRATPWRATDSLGTHLDPTPEGRQAEHRLDDLHGERVDYEEMGIPDLDAFNPGILSVLARISRPMVGSESLVNLGPRDAVNWNDFDEIRAALQREGRDSVIYRNENEGAKWSPRPLRDAPVTDQFSPENFLLGEEALDALLNRELGVDKQNYSIVVPDPRNVINVFGDKLMRRAYDEPGFAEGGLVDLVDRYDHGDWLDRQPLEPEGYAKGGSVKKTRQWLTGSVENALSHLKTLLQNHTPEAGRPDDPLPPKEWIGARLSEKGMDWLDKPEKRDLMDNMTRLQALNDWVDAQLTRYVKNDYGTEWDPLLQIAPEERHHADQMYPGGWLTPELANERLFMPPWKSRSAEYWLTDPASRNNPWLEKVDPNERVYEADESLSESLDARHLIDELNNALDPESGLPPELRLRTESLNRVSVPQASRLVGQINAWRAAQKAEASQALANNPATFLHKEYPEGFRWVQLKKPPVQKPSGEITDELFRAHSEAGDAAYDQLQDALRYEGDTMGHCVGGKCRDVSRGDYQIFSLRDAKGQPHVTVRANPIDPKPYDKWMSEVATSDPEFNEFIEYARSPVTGTGNGERSWENWLASKGREIPPTLYDIREIKGKGNRRPADKYQRFVTDFIRSGNYDVKGDLQHTELIQFRGGKTRIGDRNDIEMPSGYMTLEEAAQFVKDQGADPVQTDRHFGLDVIRAISDDAPQRDFAEGGLVKALREWNSARPQVQSEPRGAKSEPKSLADELDQLRYAIAAGFGTQYERDEGGLPGLALSTMGLPAWLDLAGEGTAPGWAVDASDRYDAHLNSLLERYNLPPTGELDVGDRYGVALGEMMGQLPVPASLLGKLKALPGMKKLGWLTEYFGPVIEPSALNYGIGTAVGGTLRQIEGPADPELNGLVDRYEDGDWLDRQPAEEPRGYAKGGSVQKTRQWLKDSVENALKRLKWEKTGPNEQSRQDIDAFMNAARRNMPQELDVDGTINSLRGVDQWINSQLARYVKNDMATDWDPLNQLSADELHMARPDPTQPWWPSWAIADTPRSAYDNPDYIRSINYDNKDDSGTRIFESNPWLRNVPPEERIYHVSPYDFERATGFEHLIDELRNATRPDSDLPRELRLRPESLSRVSVPQASRLVGQINAWRAAQKVEASQSIANNSATQVLKEYPEGFRWVELRKPQDTGTSVEFEGSLAEVGGVQAVAAFKAAVRRDTMEEVRRLAEEGMEPADIAGELYLSDYGLSDEQIMDLTKVDDDTWNEIAQDLGEGAYGNELWDNQERIKGSEDESISQLRAALKYEGDTMGHCVGGACSDVAGGQYRIFSLRDSKGQPHVTVRANPTDLAPGFKIVEVKGKSNAKPVDKYIPFVQDFLAERKWPIQGDQANTGFIFPNDLLRYKLGDPLQNAIRGTQDIDALFEAQGTQYGTKDSLLQKARELWPDRFLDQQPPGFARGGLVYDPARISALAQQLLQAGDR